MRILLVHPGAHWSTHDVFVGLSRGLAAMGAEVIPYRLDERLIGAQEWVRFANSKFNGTEQELEDIPLTDILYQACKQAVIKSLEVKADRIVVLSGLLFEPRALVLLERAGVPVLIYGTESPYDDDLYETLGYFATWMTVNERKSVTRLDQKFRERNDSTPCKVSYLPLGFDPKIHYPGAGRDTLAYPHDVVFVGTLFPGRIDLLERVDWSGVDVGMYGSFQWLGSDSVLHNYIRGGIIPNTDTTALHTSSKIVLNLFRDDSSMREDDSFIKVPGAEGINPRLIECAACGNFVISQYRPSVREIFGDLVPTFNTTEELQELINYWLQHGKERGIIESQLPKYVEGFSYHDRAQTVLEIMS